LCAHRLDSNGEFVPLTAGTEAALAKNAEALAKSSGERIVESFVRTFAGKSAELDQGRRRQH
jgi:hypothetical protein